MTHREIAKELGVSHTMIYKIELRALRKLRKTILKDFGPPDEPAPNNYEIIEQGAH